MHHKTSTTLFKFVNLKYCQHLTKKKEVFQVKKTELTYY